MLKQWDYQRQYPGEWEDMLVNIYLLLQYSMLIHPDCPYTMEQKLERMKHFRNLDVFKNVDEGSLQTLKKLNRKRYIILQLFLSEHHRINMKIVKSYLKAIGRI